MYGRLCLISKECFGLIARGASLVLRRSCSSVRPRQKFTGPGLKYFVAKSQGTGFPNEEVENIPYLTDDDLDGAGRKGISSVCYMH